MKPILQRLHEQSAAIGVLGQGYVGLVMAMCILEAGVNVVGLNVDAPERGDSASGNSFMVDVPDNAMRAAPVPASPSAGSEDRWMLTWG